MAVADEWRRLVFQPKHLAPPAECAREERDRAKSLRLNAPRRRKFLFEGADKAFDARDRPLQLEMEAFVALFARGEQAERRCEETR